MRCKKENDDVLLLAKTYYKPVIGGGDSHSFSASTALTASRTAYSFSEMIHEVKTGNSIVLLKPDYLINTRWKIFLRVLGFMAIYRSIALYRDIPINDVLTRNIVGLDIVGVPIQFFLRLLRKIKMFH